MKKLSVLVLSVIVLSSFSVPVFALTPGVRSMGMGGCGIAVSKDLTSAYYNPAGIVKGGALEARLGGGASSPDQLFQLFGVMSDPQKYFLDNQANAIDLGGSLAGIAGMSVGKVGFSIVPELPNIRVTKAAGTIEGVFNGAAKISGNITMGMPLAPSFLPIALDLGANLKYINVASAYYAPDITLMTGLTPEVHTGNGFGLDVGALGEVDIPSLTKLSVGVVMKDLFETINYTDKVNNVETTRTETAPTTIGLGVAGVVPVTGTLLTTDMVNVAGSNTESTMHFGVEQPMLGDILKGRAGWSTGLNPTTSIGVGFSLGANIDLAYVMDGKDAKANAFAFEISGGF